MLNDRRKSGDRRKSTRRKYGEFCPKCSSELIYDITNPSHLELFWCKSCEVKYIKIGKELLRLK